MKLVFSSCKFIALFAVGVLILPAVTKAQHYTQTNLVSDQTGKATVTDPNLVNPWGLTRSASSPWWVSDNNSGFSTLYTGAGSIIPINGTGTVTIPPPKGSPVGTLATPTGIVFNGSPTDFLVGPKAPAHFIFVTEDGTISGWSGGASAVLEVDNSDNGSPNGAVYKGATTALVNGKVFLYVTNFRSGRVEVYDSTFQRVRLSEEMFDDEEIPHGYAPFNIQNIGGTLFVTYAKQNAAKHDDVAGDGNGFVELYEPTGRHVGHLQRGPWLNSPWGVVWTPRDFGTFSNSILVGNFGSGKIAAFNGFTKQFIGFVKNPDDSILSIDGLWSLTFGNGGTAGPATTLFFSAGTDGETHGLFGTLTPVAAEQNGAVE
ncbi:MAG TPA: TIGR03118 family protein [Candidatus Acidoferrum sp.]|nr:TIGR03118 family protein [Candidatus Acidoferrum sp.]